MRRYLDTMYRHKVLVLIALIATPLITMLTVALGNPEYKASASIWVEPSPFLGTGQRPVSSSGEAETPTGREAAALMERLSTESFRQEIMDRVGLTQAIQQGQWPSRSNLESVLRGMGLDRVVGLGGLLRTTGLVGPSDVPDALSAGLSMIKDSIIAEPAGANLLTITYSGPEPVLGRRLVEETIVLYGEKAVALRAEEAQRSIDFFTRQAEAQQQRLSQAAIAVQDWLTAHPPPVPGQPRPPEEEAQIGPLRQKLAVEQALYETALSRLQEVQTAANAAVSERANVFQIVDPPDAASAAGGMAADLMLMLFIGLLVGGALVIVPVLVLTWMDDTVRAREDIERLVAVPYVAEIAYVPDLQKQPGHVLPRSILGPPSSRDRRLRPGPPQ